MEDLTQLLSALGMIAYCMAFGMLLWIIAAFLGHKLRLGKLISAFLKRLSLFLNRVFRN